MKNLIYNLQRLPKKIDLGFSGENDFRRICFDVQPWLAEYPSGIISAVFRRPDGNISPVEVELVGNVLSWEVDAWSTQIVGEGLLQLVLTDDGVIGKSELIAVNIENALPADAEPADIPDADWLSSVLSAAEQAKRADASAINAMNGAKGYRDEAATLLGRSVQYGGDIRNTATYATAGDLPVNFIFRIYGAKLPDLPEDTNGEIVTLSHSEESTNGTTQIFTTSAGTQYVRIKWSSAWKAWKLTTQSASDNVVIPISLFPRIGVIGDSYASGTSHDTEGGAATMHPAMSWANILARRNGVEVARYAKGGLSTITWQTDAAGLPAMNADVDCDLYILALGRNDYGNMLGDNPTETIAEFKANYNAIISAVKAKAPNACLVLMTTDYADDLGNALNDAIGELASENGIPQMIQLDDSYFRNVAAKIYKWQDISHGYKLAGGHPQPYQYAGMALAIERMLSKCIVENQPYFFYFVSDREPSHGGGSTVTIADAEKGVNLTVDGVMRNLAKVTDIPEIPAERRMEKVADFTVSEEATSIMVDLSKPCSDLFVKILYKSPAGQSATVTVAAYSKGNLVNYMARAANANGDRHIVIDVEDKFGIRDIRFLATTSDSNVGTALNQGDRIKDLVKLNQKPIEQINIYVNSGVVGAGTKVEVWGC